MSASLARRLAECADGFRNVGEFFLIAGYKFPHAVRHFNDLASAKKYFSDKMLADEKFGIFGPFESKDELADKDFLTVDNIAKVDLTVYYKDGQKQHTEFNQCIDAIFLNLSSFDKFVFPYYCRVYNAEYAGRLREKLIKQYKAHAETVNQEKHEVGHPLPCRVHSCCTYTSGLCEDENNELP